jgi:hypothetical protein
MTKAEQASQLIFKRAPIGWNDDDYDVLADGKLVGRIFKVPIAPQDRTWDVGERPQSWYTRRGPRLRADA